MTRPSVALIDHGMGNLRSVAKALEAAGAQVHLTDSGQGLAGHDSVCVPGQGIFGRCMRALHEQGLAPAISEWIEEGRPYLGICLGLQVLLDASEEPADPSAPAPGELTAGLGVIPGKVVRLDASDETIPHIGWNVVRWRDLPDTHFYFDHSYVAVPADDGTATGLCRHGAQFAAVIESGSILAVQFHPEKSSAAGISLLQDWVETL